MSIDVGRLMIEFDDHEVKEFDDFVATHKCKEEERRPMEGFAPLLCTIRIEACTIGYWKSITCELCGEKKDLTDVSTL